jgi:hypothetical protein
MKKLITILFSSISLLGLLVFLPKVIYSQGCAKCPYGSCITIECCDPCVEVRSITGQTAQCTCQIPTPTPLPTATPVPSCPGTCRTTGCFSNETPNNSYSCPHPQATCCLPLAATPTPSGQPPTPTSGQTIPTAIGSIDPSSLQGFTQSLLGFAFGVAGGIAFLLMLFGTFQIMTSSGNPEKMKAGSELITSALTGLLFIIFSVFILKLIGVTILDIPGFGK